MKIGILVAMDKELSLLLSIMPNYEAVTIGKNSYYKGKISDHDIIVGKCGIGKVNSAVNTYRIIETVNPDIIINTGVAGGASAKMKIGNILVADSIAYHDVWCGPGTIYGAADGYSPFFAPYKQAIEKIDLSDPTIKTGLICSGDKFIHSVEEIKEIKSHFPDVMAVDMESASIAQVCEMEKKPVIIIRVMSDTPGEGDNVEQYSDFWDTAPVKTFECVKKLIEKL